jgi:hypothetical protein
MTTTVQPDRHFVLTVAWASDQARFHDTHPTTLGEFMNYYKMYRGSTTFGTDDRDGSTRPQFDAAGSTFTVAFPHFTRNPLADDDYAAAEMAGEFFHHAHEAMYHEVVDGEEVGDSHMVSIMRQNNGNLASSRLAAGPRVRG